VFTAQFRPLFLGERFFVGVRQVARPVALSSKAQTMIQQVCVRLPTSADNMTLLAFAAVRRAAAAPGGPTVDRCRPPDRPTAATRRTLL